MEIRQMGWASNHIKYVTMCPLCLKLILLNIKVTTVSSFLIKLKYQTIFSNMDAFFCISYSWRIFYLIQFEQSILTKLTTCSVVSIRYVTYSSTFCRTVCIISCIHLYWKSSAHFTVITISIISSSTFWK